MRSPNTKNLDESTIFAPLCGISSGSVQIIRVSGPNSRKILEEIVVKPCEITSKPRQLCLKNIKNSDEIIDQALIVFFNAPNSYTGEDVIEINIHASSVIEKDLYDLLIKHGARAAEPGEFTKRAYLNGQLDLIQAEAVADLINSKTKMQARLAKQQLTGRLSSVIDNVAEPLRDLLAVIEAHIDFPEEGIEEQTFKQWQSDLEPIKTELNTLLSTYNAGKLTKEGAQVVLCGIPNVGKSSLLNALARDDRAIVTEIAGTTTDSIEQLINLEGYVISLWDTAGLENKRAVDKIEKLGIEKSWKKIEQANLVVFVFDLTQEIQSQLELLEKIKITKENILVVVNKSDLELPSDVLKQIPEHILISAKGKKDLANFELEIIKSLGLAKNSELILITNKRHQEAILLADNYINNALDLVKTSNESIDLLALELRASLGALTELVGTTPNEDILGRIFSKFCIGK